MRDDEPLTTVRWFFGEARYGSLILPDGWFGPPQEARHQLTWSGLRKGRLMLELDAAIRLLFENAQTVVRIDNRLVLKDFDRLLFSCRGWRGIRPVRREYGDGQVTLTAQIGYPNPHPAWSSLGKRWRNRHTGGVPVLH
jgi:hypothetical protein